MNNMMRAAWFEGYGDSDCLQIGQLPRPKAGVNEVLIEVHASSINPIDWKIRRGDFRWLIPVKMPAIPGFDLSGVVVEPGKNVTDFKAGEAVYAHSDQNPGGACAEYVALNPEVLAPKPESLTHAEAASIPLAALTSLQALRDKGHIQGGHSVLVNGASGGVGIFAVQIARYFGATVTAVCSAPNHALVQELGAEAVIDYKATDPLKPDQTYDIIFDAVANLDIKQAFRRLNRNGVYITTVPHPTRVLVSAITNLFSNKQETWILMKPSGPDLRLLNEMITQGYLKTVIDSTYSLEDLAAAHQHSQGGRARGKIVIQVK